jgi:GT2 family glycosyltransferase
MLTFIRSAQRLAVAPLRRFRAARYQAFLSSERFAGNDAVEQAMPQSLWRLEPAPRGQNHPTGLVRIPVKVEGTEGAVTGRIYHRGKAGEPLQQLAWFATDDDGRAQITTTMPAAVSDLHIAVYSSNAQHLVPHVSIQEIGKLQKYTPKVLELIRYHVRHPRVIVSKCNKVYLLLRRGGVAALKEKILRRSNYPEWVAKYDTITEADRRVMREHIEQMEYTPCISILLPVYNVPETYLRQAIESVRNQVYTHWQLCIADDNSPNAAVREVIKEYGKQDPRIVYVFKTENGHISQATNSAAELATGEFLAFLDHDDELREHALYMMVRELQEHRDADLIFSDEDKITPEGLRHDPYFKSDWNPELLLCHNCVCHFTVVRREMFNRLGGLRSECNGAQDWDLALRVSENTTRDKLRHIPHILYHWRVIEGSTAKETAAKPYVTAAQIRAVSEHLARRGDNGAVVESIPALSMLRVRYAIPTPAPLVSLIVPTHNQQRLLSQCVDGILTSTDYTSLELIIVDNRSDDPKTLHYLKELPTKDSRVRVVRDDGPFNFSRINNDAVKHAQGSILGFINNDIQVIRPDWLGEMVSNLVRKDVAAAGARLLFPNGTVQHAGVITGIGGVAGHQFKNAPISSLGYFCRAVLPQNLSAVTAACMLVHKHLFHEVGGFDQEHLAVAFNDIDLCLKLQEAGGLIVYTPYAELLHHESVSRGYEDSPEKKARFKREYKVMQDRWGAKLTSDPFYNPNFALTNVGYELGTPPKKFGVGTRSF